MHSNIYEGQILPPTRYKIANPLPPSSQTTSQGTVRENDRIRLHKTLVICELFCLLATVHRLAEVVGHRNLTPGEGEQQGLAGW